MSLNKFVVVGTGIRTSGQLTMETISWIKKADKVFFVVADVLAGKIIPTLNSSAVSLHFLYETKKSREETYREMVELMMDSVRNNKLTVAAYYGHPGVLADAPHMAVKLAKAEGFDAQMLPAISAEACLFADIGLDPSTYGCQSYEATAFLLKNKVIDNSSSLILWQVGVLCDLTYGENVPVPEKSMNALREKLYQNYPPTHIITIYEAATIVGCKPRIEQVALKDIVKVSLTGVSTIYVPPCSDETLDEVFYGKVDLVV